MATVTQTAVTSGVSLPRLTNQKQLNIILQPDSDDILKHFFAGNISAPDLRPTYEPEGAICDYQPEALPEFDVSSLNIGGLPFPNL